MSRTSESDDGRRKSGLNFARQCVGKFAGEKDISDTSIPVRVESNDSVSEVGSLSFRHKIEIAWSVESMKIHRCVRVIMMIA